MVYNGTRAHSNLMRYGFGRWKAQVAAASVAYSAKGALNQLRGRIPHDVWADPSIPSKDTCRKIIDKFIGPGYVDSHARYCLP